MKKYNNNYLLFSIVPVFILTVGVLISVIFYDSSFKILLIPLIATLFVGIHFLLTGLEVRVDDEYLEIKYLISFSRNKQIQLSDILCASEMYRGRFKEVEVALTNNEIITFSLNKIIPLYENKAHREIVKHINYKCKASS